LEIDPILLLTAFAGGYLVSHWQCRYHLLVNLALRTELKQTLPNMGLSRKETLAMSNPFPGWAGFITVTTGRPESPDRSGWKT